MNFSDVVNSETAWLAALIPGINTQAPAVSTDVQAHASAVADLYAKLDSNAADAFLSTASGDALAAKAADNGVVKDLGDPSTVTLSLVLSGTQPSGWKIDPTFQFSTKGDALNAPILFSPTGTTTPSNGATTATIAVQSTTVGINTNVLSGTITGNASGSPFIMSITNVLAASGGTDEQDDGALLVAAQEVLAPVGSLVKIQLAAQGVAGIVAAVAQDLKDGLGTVNIYALDGSNALSGATTTPAVPVSGEALAVLTAGQGAGGPGLTILVAQMTVTQPTVTVTSVTQVLGSGLTAGTIVAAIHAYLNAFTPTQTYIPSALIVYLFNVAFPGQLVDVELASLSPVSVGQFGIIRGGGSVTVVSGP